MKTIYVIILLGTAFISVNGFSQTNDTLNKESYTNLLIGKWEAYKKTDLDGGNGSDVTLNGKPYTVRLELEFLDEEKAYFNNGEGN